MESDLHSIIINILQIQIAQKWKLVFTAPWSINHYWKTNFLYLTSQSSSCQVSRLRHQSSAQKLSYWKCIPWLGLRTLSACDTIIHIFFHLISFSLYFLRKSSPFIKQLHFPLSPFILLISWTESGKYCYVIELQKRYGLTIVSYFITSYLQALQISR